MYDIYPFAEKEFWLTVKILKLYFIVDLEVLRKKCYVTRRFNIAKPVVSH